MLVAATSVRLLMWRSAAKRSGSWSLLLSKPGHSSMWEAGWRIPWAPRLVLKWQQLEEEHRASPRHWQGNQQVPRREAGHNEVRENREMLPSLHLLERCQKKQSSWQSP